MRRSIILIATAIALTSTSAYAQEPASNDSADDSALTSREGDTAVYDFEDDNVDGEILSPDGALVDARGGIKHASLITLRRHFLPELIQMALDI